MAELNREEIVAALQGFTAATISRWWDNPAAEDLAEVIGRQPLIDQQMLDLGALLLRLGLETIGLPTDFDDPEPQAGPKRRNRQTPDADYLLFVTAYDVMVLAGYNPYHNRALPAAPQAFADAPDLWRQAHNMARARE